MLVLIFLPPLAWTLNEEEVLAREGRPLTADFSKLKGAGFKLTEAITAAAIYSTTPDLANLLLLLGVYCVVCDLYNSLIIIMAVSSGEVIADVTRGTGSVVQSGYGIANIIIYQMGN